MPYLISIHILLSLSSFSLVLSQEESYADRSTILDSAVYFNGVNDHLDVGTYDADSCFSTSLWFNSNDLLSGVTALMDVDSIYWVRTTTQRELQFSQPNVHHVTTENISLSQHIWYQLVVVVDHPRARIFLNGELIASTKLKGTAVSKKASVVLGRNPWREFFKGQLAGFQFYDKALNKHEITSLYLSEKTKNNLSDNLLAFLPLNNKNIRGEIQNVPEFSSVKFIHDDVKGKVASFDSSSYIDLGGVEIDNVITIAAWIKPKTINRQALVSSGHAFAFRISAPKNLLFTIPQVRDIFEHAENLKLDKWNHVAVSYHEQKAVCFYANGIKVNEVPVDEHQQASKKLRIGNNVWNDHYFGLMYDVLIWKRILSEEEIMALSKMTSKDLRAVMPKTKSKYRWGVWIILLFTTCAVLAAYFVRKSRPKDNNTFIEINPFQKQALQVTRENMSESTFGVDQFAKEMGMSKTSLYNRMKAEFGKSPKEFIREERIKKASHLLLSSEESITQIIFSTGFESRAYFNKCFKDTFAMTPSEYRDTKPTVS